MVHSFSKANLRKIIATTDSSLKTGCVCPKGQNVCTATIDINCDMPLPKPSKQFIEEWVKNPVDKVMIEYNLLRNGRIVGGDAGDYHDDIEPKLTPNNEIIIFLLKIGITARKKCWTLLGIYKII